MKHLLSLMFPPKPVPMRTLAESSLCFESKYQIPADVQVSMWVLTDGKDAMGLSEERSLARLIVNDFLMGHEGDEVE